MQEKTINITEREYLALLPKSNKSKPQHFTPIEGEIWKSIKDTNDLYSISNLGRLRKTYETKQGELRDYILNCPRRVSGVTVRLSINPTLQRNTYLHTLVMEAFKPLPEDTPRLVVIHEDCNIENNNLDNLRWGTHSEALLYKKNCKGEKPKLRTKTYISKMGKKKVKQVWFSDSDIIKIKQLKKEGITQATIAKIINCSQTFVCKVLNSQLRND